MHNQTTGELHQSQNTNSKLQLQKGYTFVETDALWRSHLCANYKAVAKGGVHLTPEGGEAVAQSILQTKQIFQ